jgi:hypothetical protein
VIVLGSACLELCSRCLAELVAMGLGRGLIYLPIILEDVDGDALLVWKLGDSHHALVPPHDAAAVLKSFDKCGSGGEHHLETCIFGELLLSLLVDAFWPNLLEYSIKPSRLVIVGMREDTVGLAPPERGANSTPTPALAPPAG